MRYEGVVYRPPSEGRSLIVQVTIGCAHNSCTFCNMYKDKKFRVRTMEEIMKDLLEAQAMYDDVVSGRFERITPDEIIDEMTEFLQNVDSPGTVFRTNHASNYVVLKGDFNRDIPAMLKQLEQVKKNKNYRVFRETGDLL